MFFSSFLEKYGLFWWLLHLWCTLQFHQKLQAGKSHQKIDMAYFNGTTFLANHVWLPESVYHTCHSWRHGIFAVKRDFCKACWFNPNFWYGTSQLSQQVVWDLHIWLYRHLNFSVCSQLRAQNSQNSLFLHFTSHFPTFLDCAQNRSCHPASSCLAGGPNRRCQLHHSTHWHRRLGSQHSPSGLARGRAWGNATGASWGPVANRTSENMVV